MAIIRKGEKCTWIVSHTGGEFLVDYKWDKPEKSPDAVYLPRVGVFIKAADIHETRIFIPTRSIMGIRAYLAQGQTGATVDGAKPDQMMKWIEEQFKTTAEKLKERDRTIFDE